jgi:hypothetical protein
MVIQLQVPEGEETSRPTDKLSSSQDGTCSMKGAPEHHGNPMGILGTFVKFIRIKRDHYFTGVLLRYLYSLFPHPLT